VFLGFNLQQFTTTLFLAGCLKSDIKVVLTIGAVPLLKPSSEIIPTVAGMLCSIRNFFLKNVFFFLFQFNSKIRSKLIDSNGKLCAI
jgi:hypothetical protein